MDPYYDGNMRRFRSGIVQNLSFRSLSSSDVQKLSVVKVITPLTFDTLGNPLPGSLYDPKLGPLDGNMSVCISCSNTGTRCLGHFGHIELPLSVINPMYYNILCNILKITCMSCSKVMIHPVTKEVFISQIKLLDAGYVCEALELGDLYEYNATDWVRSEKNMLKELEQINKINCYVSKVMSDSEIISENVVEVRGDGDYRGMFLKKATAHITNVPDKCPFCSNVWRTFSFIKSRLFINAETTGKVSVASKFSKKVSSNSQENPKMELREQSFFLPSDVMMHFRNIWKVDSSFLKAVIPLLQYSSEVEPTDQFFMKYVLVTPTNTRPVNYQDGMVIEHPQNNVYKSILNSCLSVRTLIHLINNKETDSLSAERKELVDRMKGDNFSEKLTFAWQELQLIVNSLVDEKGRQIVDGGVGIKQLLEKKEGLIRMNMMGKRVNYAARSVITPDPNLNIDEIGIPEEFAKKLTFPVPVTEWNVTELRKKVINGPENHPGANFLRNDDGTIIKLDPKDKLQREAVAKRLLTLSNNNSIKILHRHLVNGDILLLNRQPTLHRPSIMAHKARVLKGEKTLRLHYANCKSYNADFDGDEMNAHFPQNEVARSEAYNIVAVGHQYLVPKDGSPLSGLIQDHIVSGVRMTVRGKFFTKDEYMQLVFQALVSLTGNIRTLPPAMIKPHMLWSGKQVISTIIINIIPRGKALINLNSTSKISSKAWMKGGERSLKGGDTPFENSLTMTEAEVVIHNGELLCGVLDKTHFGSSAYSLVHCVYELYGGDTSCKLLSAFSKVFTAFLQTEGFTLGVKDILVLPLANRIRRKLIKEARNIGRGTAARALGVTEGEVTPDAICNAMHRDHQFSNILDREYKLTLDRFTNDINRTCLVEGLLSPFPDNNLQLMVQSGAKGSTVNTMQISCLLGQIELEGKRPPLMISGKSLPSFRKYETSPRSGGFIDGRFMSGIQPQEFFFHCMAGREGLIDTACKTSRSGYLQRCLVKHLEGLSVQYDMTVRDSDGSLIQFLYGEDGLDIPKSQFLKKTQIPFLLGNISALGPVVKQEIFDELKSHKRKLKKWIKNHDNEHSKKSAFSIFSSMDSRNEGSSKVELGRRRCDLKLCQKWRGFSEEKKDVYKTLAKKKPDPVQSRFQPDNYWGSISEKLDKIMDNYIEENGGGRKVRDLIYHKYQAACCPPGEPVGLLAAQSVGEPSTQMTLNTFHFAGRGEMNVTLGIPRLRELLMVASKEIKTPSMEIPFLDNLANPKKTAEKLRVRLNRVNLADVLESITVTENIRIEPERVQVYVLRLKFLPRSYYKSFTNLSPEAIMMRVERKFIQELTKNIIRRGKMIKTLITMETEKERVTKKYGIQGEGEEEIKEPQTRERNDDSDDEPVGEDDDATTARRRERQQEEQQYSDIEDMEDDDLINRLEQEEKDEEEWEKEDQSEVKQEDEEEEEEKEEGATKKSVVSSNSFVEDYRYDSVNYSWCEVTLVYPLNSGKIDFSSLLKDLARKSIVRQVAGLKKAHIDKKSTGAILLKTEGINFNEMYHHNDKLDLNRLYSNDVHAIANTYGIEAAARVLVNEIKNVFQVYGITVDPRHLSLIADYMTFMGVYTPLNRRGMMGGVSPLHQMSFESTMSTIKTALFRGQQDRLENPSALLITGKPVFLGTGCFDLLQDLS